MQIREAKSAYRNSMVGREKDASWGEKFQEDDALRRISVWRISEHAASCVYRIGRGDMDMPRSRLTGMMLVGRFGGLSKE